MSFAEQVISMFSIDILFTVHGAGLTTSIFMLPGSALVEVFPPLFKEPYYMWVARFSDLVYKRITETKIINKEDYIGINKKIQLTNKVFILPPEVLKERLESVVPLVWEKKYSMVSCVCRVSSTNSSRYVVQAHPSHRHHSLFHRRLALPEQHCVQTVGLCWQRYSSDPSRTRTDRRQRHLGGATVFTAHRHKRVLLLTLHALLRRDLDVDATRQHLSTGLRIDGAPVQLRLHVAREDHVHSVVEDRHVDVVARHELRRLQKALLRLHTRCCSRRARRARHTLLACRARSSRFSGKTRRTRGACFSRSARLARNARGTRFSRRTWRAGRTLFALRTRRT